AGDCVRRKNRPGDSGNVLMLRKTASDDCGIDRMEFFLYRTGFGYLVDRNHNQHPHGCLHGSLAAGASQGWFPRRAPGREGRYRRMGNLYERRWGDQAHSNKHFELRIANVEVRISGNLTVT